MRRTRVPCPLSTYLHAQGSVAIGSLGVAHSKVIVHRLRCKPSRLLGREAGRAPRTARPAPPWTYHDRWSPAPEWPWDGNSTRVQLLLYPCQVKRQAPLLSFHVTLAHFGYGLRTQPEFRPPAVCASCRLHPSRTDTAQLPPPAVAACLSAALRNLGQCLVKDGQRCSAGHGQEARQGRPGRPMCGLGKE